MLATISRMGRPSLILALLFVPALAGAQGGSETTLAGGGRIVVEIVDLRSDDGKVLCALFGSSEGWPGDYEQAAGGAFSRIQGRRATCTFEDIPAGQYAVAMFHDEDDSDSMRRSLIGIPREGYGFSNNVGPRAFGPPRFRSAAFRFDGTRRRLRIRVRY